MGMFLDQEFWLRLWSIVIIDLTLAGDNALVIALAVRQLPKRQQFWGRVWGTAGAVALRLTFIAMTTALLRVPLLRVAGGLLLVWVAVKLVRPQQEFDHRVRHGSSLWEAIWVIIVADAVMSLDNVLGVAAAAHGDFILVVFGISFSLPVVVWGSGLLAGLMNRFTWIIWIGGGILGYVAGELIFGDELLRVALGRAAPVLAQAIPVALAASLVALGWWHAPITASRAPRQG